MTIQEIQLPPAVSGALAELKEALDRLYGERLRGLYLYGSYARGEATEDSDVDVLVVLEDEVNPYREIDRVGEIVSDVCLRHDLLIATLPVSERQLSESVLPLYVNLRREAIPL